MIIVEFYLVFTLQDYSIKLDLPGCPYIIMGNTWDMEGTQALSPMGHHTGYGRYMGTPILFGKTLWIWKKENI